MFLPWIDAEFGMSRQTADRYRQVAEVYGGKMPTVGNLPAKALYELSSPKTPEEVRDEVDRLIASGAVVTAATVRDLRAKLADAEKGFTAWSRRRRHLHGAPVTTLGETGPEIPDETRPRPQGGGLRRSV